MIQGETDAAKRMAEISEAMKIHKEEFGHIPLHQQAVVWAARDTIDLVQLADNFFPLRHAEVGRCAGNPPPPGRGQGEGSPPYNYAGPDWAATALTLTLSRMR